VTGLTSGRDYMVEVSNGGQPVDGQTTGFTADGPTHPLTFAGLTKGGAYTIVVTDSQEAEEGEHEKRALRRALEKRFLLQ